MSEEKIHWPNFGGKNDGQCIHKLIAKKKIINKNGEKEKLG